MRHARAFGAAAFVALVAGVGGCGLPTHSEAVRVPTSNLPHGVGPSRPAPGLPPTPRVSGPARVYFVTREAALAPVAAPVGQGADLTRQVSVVLERLAAGPSSADRARGLSSEVPPGSSMTVGSIRDGVARIEWATLSDGLEPRRGSLAAGQVVLSVTSISGVDQVQILRDGVPADVPLPGGELKTGPLSGTDFADLVQPAPRTPVPPTTTVPATPQATSTARSGAATSSLT